MEPSAGVSVAVMRPPFRTWSVLLAVFILGTASAGWAQTAGQPPAEACKPGGFTVIGHPDEYGPKLEPHYAVSIHDGFEGGFLTRESLWVPSIETALDKWNAVAGTAWRFELEGLTAAPPDPFDGRITVAPCGVLFDCPAGPPPTYPEGPGPGDIDFFPARQSVLAVTLIVEDSTLGKRVADSDIIFNPTMPFHVDPSDGQVDFETVLLHELGHALGLDHNDNCTSEPTVMESVVGLNDRKRALFAEEQEGVRFLYPAGGSAAVRLLDSDRRLEVKVAAGSTSAPHEIRLFGLRPERWTATATAEWTEVDPPAGRFTTDGSLQVWVDARSLPPGEYSAAVQVQVEERPAAPAAVVEIALTVEAPELSSGTPRIASVVNGANLRSGRLAPGSLFTIFGEDLASETAAAESLPLPARLAGTEVLVNGRRAPLLYVSPTQINAAVPAETPIGRGGVIVRSAAGQNRGHPVEVRAAAPELFLIEGDQAQALNADGSWNSADKPAAADEILTIYWTGLGVSDPWVGAGEAAPVERPAVAAHPVTVKIGGREAEVRFAGLAPGFAGLGQLNAVTPAGVAGRLPIQITVAGFESPLAWIWVR